MLRPGQPGQAAAESVEGPPQRSCCRQGCWAKSERQSWLAPQGLLFGVLQACLHLINRERPFCQPVSCRSCHRADSLCILKNPIKKIFCNFGYKSLSILRSWDTVQFANIYSQSDGVQEIQCGKLNILLTEGKSTCDIDAKPWKAGNSHHGSIVDSGIKGIHRESWRAIANFVSWIQTASHDQVYELICPTAHL